MTKASRDKAPQLETRTNDDDGVAEEGCTTRERPSSPSNSSNSARKRTVRIRPRATKQRPESTAEDRSRSRRQRQQQQQQQEDKEKSSSSRRHRRVSFEPSDNNAGVKTHVRRIRSRASFSQDDIHMLWWQNDELENIFRREQDTFEIFSKCCPNYKESVIRLWERCKSTSDNSGLLSASSRNHHNKENDNEGAVVLNDNSQSSHESQTSCKSSGTSTTTTTSSSTSTSNRSDEEKIAGAPARGMENDVVVSVMPGCREEAIRCVIETQRALARSSTKVRTNTVRRRYSNISRAASLFAQSIAGGDAQVAAALYDKDSSSLSSSHQRLDGRMD